MSRFVLVVLSDSVDGLSDKFNDWYSNEHVPDVLKIPGFVSGQRFEFVPTDDSREAPLKFGTPPAPRQYLALYEIETDDLVKMQQNLLRDAGTSKMPVDSSFNFESVISGYYRPISEVIERA